MPKQYRAKHPNLIWGILIIIVGISLLAEEFDLISKDVKWFLPLLIIACGINLIYQKSSPSTEHIESSEVHHKN